MFQCLLFEFEKFLKKKRIFIILFFYIIFLYYKKSFYMQRHFWEKLSILKVKSLYLKKKTLI